MATRISDGNSSVNQRIKDKFVRQHVYCDVQIDIDVLDDLEQEYQEVFEWWVVSDFLCKKLEALGHPVISDHSIWGRCSTGQAIFLDGAITKICSDIGILEGQENSWE